MNDSDRERLAEAVETDHPCTDTVGCDIAVALDNGFVEAAALLLSGATETPALDATGIAVPGYQSTEFQAWADWYREHGHECPACESFMFSDSFPVRCTNCLEEVP